MKTWIEDDGSIADVPDTHGAFAEYGIFRGAGPMWIGAGDPNVIGFAYTIREGADLVNVFLNEAGQEVGDPAKIPGGRIPAVQIYSAEQIAALGGSGDGTSTQIGQAPDPVYVGGEKQRLALHPELIATGRGVSDETETVHPILGEVGGNMLPPPIRETVLPGLPLSNGNGHLPPVNGRGGYGGNGGGPQPSRAGPWIAFGLIAWLLWNAEK